MASKDRHNDQQELPPEPERTETAEAEAESPVEFTAEEFKRLQADRDALFERLARTTADYQNARKRLQAEKDQAVRYANSALLKSLLPVLDSFDRALEVEPEKSDTKSILKGMRIVYDQLHNVLRNQQMETIEPAEGEPFDPNLHEALMQQEDDRFDEPAVTQLFQKGYTLHGRTLRPAQVAVSKGQ